MKDLKTYIESGILEAYVLGSLSADEHAEVSALCARNPEILAEIEAISAALEQIAFEQAVEPDPTSKPFYIATIDYLARIENGETPTFPPMLHDDSRMEDFAPWLDRPDMQMEGEMETAFHAKIIGYTPEQTTVIAWLKFGSPPEIHTKEYEKFLILEGTCDILIGETTHHLKAGDCLSIPLHISHSVTVTSSVPCKVILQRIAA